LSLPPFGVPDEMVVCLGVRVEKVDENVVVIDETASYEWVGKLVDRHGVIVEPHDIVELNFLSLNGLLITRDFAESPEPKLTIVHVNHSKFGSRVVLFDLFHFDIRGILSTNFFLKSEIVGFKIIHFDIESLMVFLAECYCLCRIISNEHRYYGVHGHHILLFNQILEVLFVLQESHVRF